MRPDQGRSRARARGEASNRPTPVRVLYENEMRNEGGEKSNDEISLRVGFIASLSGLACDEMREKWDCSHFRGVWEKRNPKKRMQKKIFLS